MLLFVVLALLFIPTKSLIPIFATEVGFSLDAVVVVAGLLSFIGLFGYIFRPQTPAGKGFDCSRRGVSVAEGHFETTDDLQQGIPVHASGRPMAGSSLVRRLVGAKDDPAKQRIRVQLSGLDDERLFCLGLTSEDIAALRGTAGLPAETIALEISPPIAGLLDATDDVRRQAGDTPRRERVAHMLDG